jgi:hypothetical protein
LLAFWQDKEASVGERLQWEKMAKMSERQWLGSMSTSSPKRK